MRILLLHPTVAMRDCGDCQKWYYDENTGRRMTTGHTRRLVPRPAGTLPCRLPVGCPKGSPENPVVLTPENERAYSHYLESRAVGQFPDDPIVRKNAAIIRAAEDDAEISRENARHRQLLTSILDLVRTIKLGV